MSAIRKTIGKKNQALLRKYLLAMEANPNLDILTAIKDHLNLTIHDHWYAQLLKDGILVAPIGVSTTIRTIILELEGDIITAVTPSIPGEHIALAQLSDPNSLDYLTQLVNTTIDAKHKRIQEIHKMLQTRTP